jgi:histone-lysine N-methyltransferase SUV39H
LSVIAPARKVVLDGHKSRKRPRGSDTLLYPKKQRFSCDELRQDKKGCRWCQLARFSTHERYPITISNDVDNSTLPSDFFFIERSILRSGVEAADRAFRSGCDCQEDKQCQYKNCHCLQDVEFRGGNPGPKTKIHAYYSKGPKKDCLRPEMLESRDPIYECHDGCSCSLDCSNRVVERGRKVPLEIFKTSDGRGWGKSQVILLAALL